MDAHIDDQGDEVMMVLVCMDKLGSIFKYSRMLMLPNSLLLPLLRLTRPKVQTHGTLALSKIHRVAMRPLFEQLASLVSPSRPLSLNLPPSASETSSEAKYSTIREPDGCQLQPSWRD